MPSVTYVPSRIGEGFFTDWQAPASGATDTGKVWAWNDATGRYEPTTLPTVVTDHGALSGLADDDHTQYLLATGARTGASSSLQAFTNGVITGIVRPASDSVTAVQMQNAAGSSSVIVIDTNSNRIGINGTPVATFYVVGSGGAVTRFTDSTVQYRLDMDIDAGGTAFTSFDNIGGAHAPITFNSSYTYFYSTIGTRFFIDGGLAAIISPSRYLGVNIGFSPLAFVDVAGNTDAAPLCLRHGSAPTNPNDGDMWTTSGGLYVRINGSTVGPLS